VRLDVNQNLVLQWFNHRDPNTEDDALICAPLVLGIAYSNFWTILRSLGGDTVDGLLYVEREDDSWVVIRHVNPRSRERSDSAAFVPRNLLELMRRMQEWSADYRRAKAARRVAAGLVERSFELLQELQVQTAEPPQMKVPADSAQVLTFGIAVAEVMPPSPEPGLAR
jgi:hypothetical protein